MNNEEKEKTELEINQDLVTTFRATFLKMPDDLRAREVLRLLNIIENKPVIVLEDHSIGKVLKFIDVQNLIEYFWVEKRIRVDKSFIYKVLKGQYANAYGYRIYYEFEGEKND
jgi:hypothetical protein